MFGWTSQTEFDHAIVICNVITISWNTFPAEYKQYQYTESRKSCLSGEFGFYPGKILAVDQDFPDKIFASATREQA